MNGDGSFSRTCSLEAKLDSCNSVADGDAIKEEVSGPENLIACRESKTNKVKNDIRAVRLESELSQQDDSKPPLQRRNLQTMREEFGPNSKEYWEELARGWVMNGDGSFSRRHGKR